MSGLFQTGYFTTDVYNALQIVLVFLNDVPKPANKRKCQNNLDIRLLKHRQNGAINICMCLSCDAGVDEEEVKFKVKDHVTSSNVKWRPYRIIDELVAPLSDRLRNSTVQIRASFF